MVSIQVTLVQAIRFRTRRNIWNSKQGRPFVSHLPVFVLPSLPQLLITSSNSNNSNTDVKMTSPAAAAVKKKRSKPLALTDAAQKAKVVRFVQEMAKFEKEQGRHRRSDS